MLRIQSSESVPDQRHSQHVKAGLDLPCAVCNIDTRWLFAASVPVDSDIPCEVAPSFGDPEVRKGNTYHGVAWRIACLDGLVEVEVELPSRQVLMENFRSQVEEDPVRAYVSDEKERWRRRRRRR